MKVRVFTLGFDAAAGGFVDGALNAFMATHEALEVRHEFFIHERSPWLLVLVGYRPATEGRPPDSLSSARGPSPGRKGPHPADDLSPEERARYDRLHAWRAERAQLDGVSLFVVLTNRQMAEVARRNPRTLGELVEVAGVGEAKRGKYGDDVLLVLWPGEERGAAIATDGAADGAAAEVVAP